jgi:hypothetical protein
MFNSRGKERCGVNGNKRDAERSEEEEVFPVLQKDKDKSTARQQAP